MKTNLKLFLTCLIGIAIFSCSTETLDTLNSSEDLLSKELTSDAKMTQISGIGYYADPAECDYEAEGAVFALILTGDLEGCLYVYVDDYGCSPSGTYREEGREKFVGTYNGEYGTFWTNYRFEAKFEGCEDGFFVGAEIFGRCQHPIQQGSGDGVFENIEGRLDFKDNIEEGSFPYRGHLRL